MKPFRLRLPLIAIAFVSMVLAVVDTSAAQELARPANSAPRLLRVESQGQSEPGIFRLKVTVSVQDPSAELLIAGKTFQIPLQEAGLNTFTVDIPDPEPGFARVRIRSGGLDSNGLVVPLRTDSLTQTLHGHAAYQKVEVTDNGLDFSRTGVVPIRNARVEVIDRTTQTIVSVSETDNRGQFDVAVPNEPDLTVRVVSRLRSHDVKVLDNTSGNEIYWISKDIDMRDPQGFVELIDRERRSGAFNILDVIQNANALVLRSDSRAIPPPVTIFWSERNTNRTGSIRDGFVGTTFFDLESRTAFILGDRSTDSDEFDDSVILHEYAHMLAARFSRDDSPGGAHGMGDLLDPRVAWSEGWANFFSSAVRGTPFYRDSKGPEGGLSVRYDLEENVPAGDRPGYRSEASVASLLWDMVDENADTGDGLQLSFATMWEAFAGLRNDRLVYLPYFLERVIARNPFVSDPLRLMVQLRSIEFQPNIRPSIANPFPSLITAGSSVAGEVDSLSTRRSNLAQSAHFFMFTLAAPSPVSINLQIDGLGPANNPAFNDLDVFLTDLNGQRLQQSNRGLNGQPEMIATPYALPAGTYVIEVRSFYARSETGSMVYNSGHYRLTLSAR